MRTECDRSKLIRHLHDLLVQTLLLLLEVLDQVGLLLQKLCDVGAALHKTDGPSYGAYALQGVWWRPGSVELHDSSDVGSVDDEEDEGLGHREGGHVDDWAAHRLHALFQKSVPVKVLKPGGNSENRCIPKTHYCQRDGLVAVRCSVEVVVAVQAQLVVVVADNVIENLRDKKISKSKNSE